MREVLMTYCYPEQTQESRTPFGRTYLERVPNHPKRPARATDCNTWRERVPGLGPIITSFYTLGTPYEDEARALLRTMDFHGVAPEDHDVVGVEPLGSWVQNCSLKAKHVLGMIRKHRGRPVVWVDADARLCGKPALFDELNCDFAAHWLNGELLSGTLYFSPSAKAEELAVSWARACEADPQTWDQKHLADCVEAMGSRLNVVNLPPTYCWIQADDEPVDISGRAYGDLKPVIRQTQASRRWAHR